MGGDPSLPVPDLRHPEPPHGVTLEVELDQDRRLVSDNPPSMSRFDGSGLWSNELKGTAIRVWSVDLAAGQEPDKRVHAKIGANDRFHVRGPAKPGWVDHALHAACAGPHHIDLGAAGIHLPLGARVAVVDFHERSSLKPACR